MLMDNYHVFQNVLVAACHQPAMVILVEIFLSSSRPVVRGGSTTNKRMDERAPLLVMDRVFRCINWMKFSKTPLVWVTFRLH